MTVLLSFPSPECILMFSDSAMTREFQTIIGDAEPNEGVEYETTNKIYSFPGRGCVTIWGHLNNMQLRLKKLEATFRGGGLVALKDEVVAIMSTLSDGDDPYPEVGCHVGGFVDGKPCLRHVFWGRSRPLTSDDEAPALHSQDESHVFALYNGRYEYVHKLLALFLEKDRAPVHSPRLPWDCLLIGAYVIAFITQLTCEVSEPVKVAVIRLDNKLKTFPINQIIAPPSELKSKLEIFLESVNHPAGGNST